MKQKMFALLYSTIIVVLFCFFVLLFMFEQIEAYRGCRTTKICQVAFDSIRSVLNEEGFQFDLVEHLKYIDFFYYLEQCVYKLVIMFWFRFENSGKYVVRLSR